MNAGGGATGVARLTEAQILHGHALPDAESVMLGAGELEAALQGVELAYVRRGEREVVRRIHVSVRDENWDTIVPIVDGLEIERLGDRVAVTFSARHEAGAIAFGWDGRIEITADGTLRYDMDGRAERSFRYCRIGFCVLHGDDSYAGRPYRASAPGFPPSSGTMPIEIAPQWFSGGVYLPVIPVYTRLEVELAGDLGVRFDFEGELFELEDQRNWTDASFKTYCTPADKGFPLDARAGQRFRQRVAMSLTGPPPAPRRRPPRVVEVELGATLTAAMPAIGTYLAGSPPVLSAREADALRALRPSHLRVDVALGHRAGAAAALATAAAAARAVGAQLEIAVFATDDAVAELPSLLSRVREGGAAIARVLVFDRERDVTPPALVEVIRKHVRAEGIEAPVGGGTDLWFAEINREPPDPSALELLSFSTTPEVHAFDDASIVETLPLHAAVVRAASALAPGLPVVVSPVTLRPRNSAVTADSRQRSLFCAAWTVGAVKYLAESGAAAATFYEAIGARGIMESDEGTPAVGGYPELAGVVFPVYHVLAAACSLAGCAQRSASSSDPARAEAFAAVTERALHVVVANMRAAPEHVRVGRLSGRDAFVRTLDLASAARAMASPSAFHGERAAARCSDGALELDLGPYAVAFIEIAIEPHA